MESTALVLYGAVSLGLLALLFLVYELRNAPYSDEPEPVPAKPEPRRAQPLRS